MGIIKAESKQETPIKQAEYWQPIDTIFNAYRDKFDNPMWCYKNIPQLAEVIDKKNDYFKKIKFKLKDYKTGADYEKETHIQAVLENPNVIDTEDNFFSDLLRNCDIFGTGIANYNIGKTTGRSSSAFVLNSEYLTVSGDKNKRSLLTGEVEIEIKYTENNLEYLITNNEDTAKIHLKNTVRIANALDKDQLNNFVLGISKIKTLKKPLENIFKSYLTQGTEISTGGLKAIISSGNSGSMSSGATKLQSGEKSAISKKIADYFGRIGKHKDKGGVVVLENNIKVDKLTTNVKNLELTETRLDGRDTIANAYGMPTMLFKSDVKLLNLEAAEKQAYTNVIIPDANQIVLSFNRAFGLGKKKGFLLVADTSNIEVLSKDKKSEAETNKALFDLMCGMLEKDTVSEAEFKEINRANIGLK